jgi:hypothetical protein
MPVRSLQTDGLKRKGEHDVSVRDLGSEEYERLRKDMLEAIRERMAPPATATPTMPDNLTRPLSWKRRDRENFCREIRGLAESIASGAIDLSTCDLRRVNADRYKILKQEVVEATYRQHDRKL